MRISVECGGFTRAADACRTANQTAAVLTESLASRLASHAGMAGNDATSASFAASYDTGATEALAALADLTHAFIGAGRLLAATGRHHAAAEAGAAGLRTSAYVGGDLHENDYVRVQPAAPPSTLGGQEPSLGRIDTWILDQVEGFVWPGADVGGLRTAASDWRRAAATTSRLADHVDAAVALVEQQHSPEVPLAVDALTDLAGLVGDTGWQLSTVADACEEYAAAVEEARERTRALLAEIAQMVVEGAAVSALVAGVTGGLGGSAALGAAAARVRAQAPRFHALLLALRTGTTTAAARVDRARDDLVRIRSQVERFVRVPARTERGSMRGPGGWGGPDRKPGWLNAHEHPPGHTIDRHVGKTADELRDRLANSPKLSAVSSFDDQQTAERLIESVLDRRSREIDDWLNKPQPGRLTLTEDLGVRTGTTVARDGTATHPTGLRVVLLPDPDARSGWRILTAFPD